SLNVRGAYLHVLSDALASVGVVAAALVVVATGWTLADPLASVAIALIIVPRTWGLLKQAVNVLLEGTPTHLDLAEIEAAIVRVPGVRRVHDLHVWTLTSGREAMSAHVIVTDVGESDRLLRQLHEVLHARFGIDHTTIQLEMEPTAPLRRYGQVIGFATQDIEAGDHVHTHNLGIGELQREYEFCTDVHPVQYHPPEAMRTFDGFKREDGRVGTRNYVAIISGVNCSASVSAFVKDKFRDVQRDYPNVDGVLAITHKSGCGTKLFGEDHLALQRVLAGYAKHPNVAAYILVGLGCETNQAAVMVERQRMAAPGHPERKPFLVNIQEAGGIRKTVERA